MDMFSFVQTVTPGHGVIQISFTLLCKNTIGLFFNWQRNNGFLAYYRLEQIPNFLLALPLSVAVFKGLSDYVKRSPKLVMTLGLINSPSVQVDYYSKLCLPYVYLCLFMFLYCLFFMHVQVMLRFLSSQPAIYWYMATEFVGKFNNLFARGYIAYCILYSLIGTVLFANYLPPA